MINEFQLEYNYINNQIFRYWDEMPAKKKKGKKGKKGKEEPEPEDQYMTMRGEELEINIANLKEKLQDMKIRRNYL